MEVCAFLGRAIRRAGSKPKSIITDKGKEFDCWQFKSWCRRRDIALRFGAIGKHGSIAVVERFIRSMKSECTRRILVPYRLDAMQRELGFYTTWYNEHRPHMRLAGRTPAEAYDARAPARDAPGSEPRPRWRHAVGERRGRPGARLALASRYVDNRRHLPVVELKQAA